MMGHREQLKSGDEYDALTRWRRYVGYRAGTVKAIKRKFNKRIRREAKQPLAQISISKGLTSSVNPGECLRIQSERAKQQIAETFHKPEVSRN